MHLFVFVTSEVSFTFPVTCLCLVIFWVLHPAAVSTKVDSKEPFSKSRVPPCSVFLFTSILTHTLMLTHTHTHTLFISLKSILAYMHSHNAYPSHAHTHSCMLIQTPANLLFCIHANTFCLLCNLPQCTSKPAELSLNKISCDIINPCISCCVKLFLFTSMQE